MLTVGQLIGIIEKSTGSVVSDRKIMNMRIVIRENDGYSVTDRDSEASVQGNRIFIERAY